MNNTQTSLRFYIDQADDKAVIRAVPVKPVVVRNTHRITVAEAPGEAITIAETKPDRQLPVIQRPQIARSASERVSRLVRRHSAKKS